MMSKVEVERLKVIHKIMAKEMTQIEGAAYLELSGRQIRRIVKRVRLEGDKGIVHKGRGRESPHKMSVKEEARIGRLIQDKYEDFVLLLTLF